MKMKLIIFGLAFVAFAAGEQYLPPNEVAVEYQYLPPSAEAAVVQPDNQYLAPVQEVVQDQPQPENEYLPPIAAVEPIEQIAEDGYRYKTVKRIRYRTRRDVSELTSGQYIPPAVEDSYGPPPSGPVDVVQESAVLADDGYRYKTVKRVRHRNRRDVNELASAEYLPPVQQDDSYSYPAPAPVVEAALVEIPAPIEIAAPAEESAVLADDGYRYKTVRRIRYRHRRDVSELPTAEYLPPVQQDDSYSYPAPAPVVEAAPVEIPAPVEISAPAEESSLLADDGYRYKTVRRIRYRHRRDVSELPTAEYLPPVQQDDSYSYPAPIEVSAPIAISAPIPIQQSAELADDGYRYKTVKKYKIKRH